VGLLRKITGLFLFVLSHAAGARAGRAERKHGFRNNLAGQRTVPAMLLNKVQNIWRTTYCERSGYPDLTTTVNAGRRAGCAAKT
jgi:hypothetical protein